MKKKEKKTEDLIYIPTCVYCTKEYKDNNNTFWGDYFCSQRCAAYWSVQELDTRYRKSKTIKVE